VSDLDFRISLGESRDPRWGPFLLSFSFFFLDEIVRISLRANIAARRYRIFCMLFSPECQIRNRIVLRLFQVFLCWRRASGLLDGYVMRPDVAKPHACVSRKKERENKLCETNK